MLAVCIPYDQNDPAPGNGNMMPYLADRGKVSISFIKKLSNLVLLMRESLERDCPYSMAPMSETWMEISCVFLK